MITPKSHPWMNNFRKTDFRKSPERVAQKRCRRFHLSRCFMAAYFFCFVSKRTSCEIWPFVRVFCSLRQCRRRGNIFKRSRRTSWQNSGRCGRVVESLEGTFTRSFASSHWWIIVFIGCLWCADLKVPLPLAWCSFRKEGLIHSWGYQALGQPAGGHQCCKDCWCFFF